MSVRAVIWHPIRSEQQHRLRRLGFTHAELAELTAAEQQLIARWLAPPTGIGLARLAVAYFAIAAGLTLPQAASVSAAVWGAVTLTLLTLLTVLVIFAVDAVTRRWRDPNRLLGEAAWRALRTESAGRSTRWHTRSERRSLKWAVHRHLERATGHRLSITWGTGNDFAGDTRRVMVDHARGEFIDPTRPAAPPRNGDRAAAGLVWATALAPALAALFGAVP